MEEPRFHIEAFSFGKLTINGKTYKKDLIICPDEILENWWRKEGHSLHPEDLESVIGLKPEVLIMGCGANNRLKVPDSTRQWIQDKGMEIIEAPTGEACERFNEIAPISRVIAGFHLTC